MILLDKARNANNYCKEIETAFMDALRPLNITLNLNQLILLDSLTKTDVPHKDCYISRNAMSYNLNKLVNLELITKITKYCTDTRKIKFRLTDKGEELLDYINKAEKKLLKETGVNKNVK